MTFFRSTKCFTNWTCRYWGITQGSYKTAEIASKSHDIAYTVPLSFVYQEGGTGLGTIGFHCAKTGHKIDAIRRNTKVSFTVIDRDEVMPRERTTKFRSVIAFGRARILEDEEEIRRAANAVGAKYSRGFEDLYMQETEDTIREGRLCCVEITINHMTGKIGRQLLLERQREGKSK